MKKEIANEILKKLFMKSNITSIKESLALFGNECEADICYLKVKENYLQDIRGYNSYIGNRKNRDLIKLFNSMPFIFDKDVIVKSDANYFSSKLDSLALVSLSCDNNTLGTLMIANSNCTDDDLDTLKEIASYFAKALSNVREVNRIVNESFYDNMTGVKNNNAFLRDSKKYSNTNFTQLGLVYFDVNGLHDVNNNAGHNAGDILIKRVSSQITRSFNMNNVYRIGGDEFVVMTPSYKEEEIYDRANYIVNELAKEDIHVSYGISYGNSGASIEKLKEVADSKMYKYKEEFYKRRNLKR